MKMLASDEDWNHALPILACNAVTSVQVNAVPVAAAWITFVHAANIIDDVQDGNFGRLAQFESPQLAITVAVAWIFAAFRMLDDLSLDSETRHRVTTLFASAGFDAARGQYQDLVLGAGKSEPDDPLQAYWSAVILKSGSICRAAAAAGAAAGAGSASFVEALGDYGTALGVIRQVIDDGRDFWIDAEVSDNQHTLPDILHSTVADQPPRKRVNLKNNRRLSGAWTHNQSSKVLIEAGIPEIIADILLEWRRRALESLSVLEPSEARHALEDVLEYVLTPKLHGT
jgi:geranylgeranyl pyrophosphate synthase